MRKNMTLCAARYRAKEECERDFGESVIQRISNLSLEESKSLLMNIVRDMIPVTYGGYGTLSEKVFPGSLIILQKLESILGVLKHEERMKIVQDHQQKIDSREREIYDEANFKE